MRPSKCRFTLQNGKTTSHARGNRTGLSQNLKSWEGEPSVSLATIPSVLLLQESRHPCLKQHSLWDLNVDILFPLLRRVLLSAPETLHSLSEVFGSPVDNSYKIIFLMNMYFISFSEAVARDMDPHLTFSVPPTPQFKEETTKVWPETERFQIS